MPINIILADDHIMVREGLRKLLEMGGDIKVIGEANDGVECLQLLERKSPDILLLDISMPNMNGIEVLKKMTRKQKVLILTIHNEMEYLMQVVDMGINGYVLKNSKVEVLRTAIFAIHAGDYYIQESLEPLIKEAMKKNVEKGKQLSHEILTKRELEVLKLLSQGLYNKEIAAQLSISEKTVKNHVSRLFKKINVSDRTQAAVYAIKNNIVDL